MKKSTRNGAAPAARRTKRSGDGPAVTTTSDEARQVLEAERAARMQACNAEIAAALKRHNCRLEASVVVTAGGNVPRIEILPND